MNSERVAGSRLFGTDSYATAAAAAARLLWLCARARTAGRAAAAVWASERASVALSTGATTDPRARRVISRRDGYPALRVLNEICRDTRPKNGDFPPTDLRDRDSRRVLHDQTNLGPSALAGVLSYKEPISTFHDTYIVNDKRFAPYSLFENDNVAATVIFYIFQQFYRHGRYDNYRYRHY